MDALRELVFNVRADVTARSTRCWWNKFGDVTVSGRPAYRGAIFEKLTGGAVFFVSTNDARPWGRDRERIYRVRKGWTVPQAVAYLTKLIKQAQAEYDRLAPARALYCRLWESGNDRQGWCAFSQPYIDAGLNDDFDTLTSGQVARWHQLIDEFDAC